MSAACVELQDYSRPTETESMFLGSMRFRGLFTTAGRLSAVTDLNNGSYTATLTAPTTPGEAVITGELAGEKIGAQATVTLQAQCVVPGVRGKSVAAAKSALIDAHCRVGSVKTVHSTSVVAGKVISQSPAAGRRFAAGTRINLTVSRGGKR
jgi:hypothetical protein